jgi:hypothetical protein
VVPEVGPHHLPNKKNKTMKRVIMAAALLVSTVTVFATETKGVDMTKEVRKEEPVKPVSNTCTVSLTAKVGPVFAQIEVQCSNTAANCKEAFSGAIKCLEAARKAIQ